MADDMKMIIKIENKKPIELLDLANSMLSLSCEYNRYIERGENNVQTENVRLYVKEIRSGSIITELVSLAPYTLPLIEYSTSIIEFAGYLKTAFDWFISPNSIIPPVTDKKSLQSLVEILEPVAKDNGSQFNIGAFNVQGDLTINITYDSVQANAAQNGIKRYVDTLKEPVSGLHEQVVMYWVQARNHNDKKAGDKARIESIYIGDVKVKFKDDQLKVKMLFEEPFPFQKAFIIDVIVETIDEKPVLYKVIELHDVMDK